MTDKKWYDKILKQLIDIFHFLYLLEKNDFEISEIILKKFDRFTMEQVELLEKKFDEFLNNGKVTINFRYIRLTLSLEHLPSTVFYLKLTRYQDNETTGKIVGSIEQLSNFTILPLDESGFLLLPKEVIARFTA